MHVEFGVCIFTYGYKHQLSTVLTLQTFKYPIRSIENVYFHTAANVYISEINAILLSFCMHMWYFFWKLLLFYEAVEVGINLLYAYVILLVISFISAYRVYVN